MPATSTYGDCTYGGPGGTYGRFCPGPGIGDPGTRRLHALRQQEYAQFVRIAQLRNDDEAAALLLSLLWGDE